jgi:hypothetical protein
MLDALAILERLKLVQSRLPKRFLPLRTTVNHGGKMFLALFRFDSRAERFIISAPWSSVVLGVLRGKSLSSSRAVHPTEFV